MNPQGMARVVLAASLLALPAAPVSRANAAPAKAPPGATGNRGDYVYAVKRGDMLIKLTTAYLTGIPAMHRVERINHVTAERRLPIGKQLLIPRGLLRDEASEAQVASFSGEVTLLRGGAAAPASLNAHLPEGAEVTTGRNAYATLRLADGTLLALPSDTRVRLTHLRRVLIDGAIERNIALTNGRVRAAVVPMHDPHSSFEVTTPLSVSAVRGTHFGVAYGAEQQAAATSVEEGGVEEGGIGLGAAGTGRAAPALTVPAGFGVATTPAGNSGVLALLPAPALNDPGKVQTGDMLHFALVPVAGAVAYRVGVAKDAGAYDLLDEAGGGGDFTLPAQPAGSYFLRVSAIDAHGIEGKSDVYAFERRRNTISGGASGDARHFRFDWQASADGTPRFHFRLVRNGAAGETPVVTADEAGLTAPSLTLTGLPPGDYAWTVSSTIYVGGRAIEDWTPPQTVHVFAAH